MEILFKLVLGCILGYGIIVLLIAFFQNLKAVKTVINKTYENVFGQTSFFDDLIFKTLGLIIIGTVILKALN